jgi:hypothetical protein
MRDLHVTVTLGRDEHLWQVNPKRAAVSENESLSKSHCQHKAKQQMTQILTMFYFVLYFSLLRKKFDLSLNNGPPY